MKKIVFLFVLLLCMAGCEDKEEVSNSNRVDTNSNSNVVSTNSNSNSLVDDENVGKYDVHLYLFHSNSCDHCKDEIKWLNSIEKDYKYLKIHYYEVGENSKIYDLVKEKMGIESNSVPLTIIGNDYYIGISDAKQRKFIRAVKEQSKKDYCDVVGTILNNGNVKECIKKNEGM